jgi:uncharacterized glyoxalase superfamily protein PhnB
MQGVIPYVTVDGAEEAAAFYREAFGAAQIGDTVRSDDGRVLHIGLEVNGGMLMLNDPFPEHGGALPGAGLQAITLQLVVADGDLWWSRAVAAGCTVVHPLDVAFWGGRYGRLRDPYGHDWAVHQPATS